MNVWIIVKSDGFENNFVLNMISDFDCILDANQNMKLEKYQFQFQWIKKSN